MHEQSHVGEYTPYKHKHQDLWLKFNHRSKDAPNIYLKIDVNSEIQLAFDFLRQYTQETVILQ
jgi:hypothetical protein